MNPSTDLERLAQPTAPAHRGATDAPRPKSVRAGPKGPTDSGAGGEATAIRRRARSAARADSTEALWRRYARKRNDETRNQLVDRYQALVCEIVRHFAVRLPKKIDRGDLATASNFGLISAIEGFDPTRGVRFESYCELRVKGALLDELRTQDWLPRPRRARIEERKRVVERLRAEFSREPDEVEVARAMGLAADAYQAIFGALLNAGASGTLAQSGDGEDTIAVLDIVPDEASHAAEEKLTREDILRLVTSKLSVLEYRLVYLKYWEELSMREIGAMMRMSESRVCKVHQKMIERLHDRLGADARD